MLLRGNAFRELCAVSLMRDKQLHLWLIEAKIGVDLQASILFE